VELKQHLELNCQCYVEPKQHVQRIGIYNQSSNNTHANIWVPQIRTRSCTTLFLTMPSSLPKQSATSQCLPLDCNNCQRGKNWQKWPPYTNSSKSWHQQMSQVCHIQHGQMHTNHQSDFSKYNPLN
jgi:hypothetical protein